MIFTIIYLIGFVVFFKPVFKKIMEMELYPGAKIDAEDLVFCSIITLVVLMMWPIYIPGVIVWRAVLEPLVSRIADDMNKAR